MKRVLILVLTTAAAGCDLAAGLDGLPGAPGAPGEAGPPGASGVPGPAGSPPLSRDNVYGIGTAFELEPGETGGTAAFCDTGDALLGGSCEVWSVDEAAALPRLPGRDRPVLLPGVQGWDCTATNQAVENAVVWAHALCYAVAP